MKTIKKSLVLLLVMSLLASLFSCYVVSGQKMDKVKGTYKLSSYSYTPSYERKNGYTAKSRNYVTDEEYLYEDYLVITGSNTGYYVHKAVNTEAYSKVVTLRYEYSQENSSEVEYVIFNDALSVNSSTGTNKLGVSKNRLNYSKPAFDYTELFTDRQMRSEDISVSWEKVDGATDLSYVQTKLGNLNTYSYEGFGARGIYELTSVMNLETSELIQTDYQYFFYVIDTAENASSATVYYATTDSPTTPLTRTVTITQGSSSWESFTMDGSVWSNDPLYSVYYCTQVGNDKITITCVSSDISESTVQYYIENRLPTE